VNVSDILASIDQGTMALPEFQRGYVWSREQVRGLMQSFYRSYPVGSLLVWQTHANMTKLKGNQPTFGPIVELLLDGQQRVTSLYGIMRGHPPLFFQGNPAAFTDLYFDLRKETFEFYGPVKMKGDPLWVSVTQLFQEGLEPWFGRLTAIEGLDAETKSLYFARLGRLYGIEKVDLHKEPIVGTDRTIDEVVEIFNRVNSGGTKLSKGDLALARICAEWPEARQQMLERIEGWTKAGFSFKLDWLLRVTNAIVTNSADFTALREVSPDQLGDGLASAGKSVDTLLNLIGSKLGLDHDRVLGGRYAFPVMARVVALNGGKLTSDEQQLLLFWYVHNFLWGRYSGSTETVLQQDLEALQKNGLAGLISVLELWRGDLKIRPEHFVGANRGSRFYPMLYMLSRVGGAQDLFSGVELKEGLLGKMASLELHHIFPKGQLEKHGYAPSERNALGNFCFLTKETNLAISMREPVDYFAESRSAQPGALSSQWIPDDEDLWQMQNYPKFLAKRRDLLAKAANELLDGLRAGAGSLPKLSATLTETSKTEDEEPALLDLVGFVRELKLAPAELHYEIVDEATGEVLAQADAAWPDGLQAGLSEPTAFLLEPDGEMEGRFGELGYRFFTDRARFDQYLEELIGIDLDGDGVIGFTEADEDPEEPALSAVASEKSEAPSDSLVPEVVAFVVQNTDRADVGLRLAYLQRCVQELGLEVRLPKNLTRKYLNIYPRSTRWVARVAAMRPGSGRIGIYADPEAAAEFENAAVVFNNNDPVYVKVYARSSEAIDDAIELTKRAIDR